ncbi:hypothetical protein, variant [Blastomyces dermatitidis ATCC 26199]|nr:hypothetical protein, variant [Blastomyces dermatitidis ATCC 26199]
MHIISLTVHRSQPHRLLEISIFILFICVNAVVIGIGLSGLRRGDTPTFYYPLGICTAFPLALEMIRQSKIQAGPLFLGYGFLSSLVKLSLILVSSVTYKALVKGTAVIVSIDYMVLAGLLLWRGIRGIPFAIHAILVIITAGFAAGGLVHDWPLWIEAMLIITICVYMARPGNTLADLGQLSLYQESRSAHLPFIPGRTMAATSMTEESYTQLDEVRTARPESAHLSNSNFQKIRAVTSIYYPNRPELKTGVFTVLCEGCQGNYQRELRYNELADYSNWEDALRSFGLSV